ncbi:MAG: S8 family serine peptidase, partial [Halolamina sp.]
SQSPTGLPGLRSLHEAGVTGDNVTVGVIGQRFNPSHRSLGDSVAGSRRFGGAGPLFADERHDTAVAEIVARTAPESKLYLAGVGREATPERYAKAVQWLLERDVDIVIDAASYFPASAEGMDRLNDVAATAADSGVVFVTSAGNYGNRHWAGTVDGEGWVEFAPGTEYNALGTDTISGRTSLRLYWTGDAEFDLYLYRASPGEDTLVAKSATNQTDGGPHSEAIDAVLPTGRYYVAVRGGEGADGTEIELFTSAHSFAQTSESGGMVAPATAENVIAVGAGDAVTGQPRPYSSGGPKLDISAPGDARTQVTGELRGSSAAAPLVAGTIALMASQNESLTPAAVQRVLQRTATRIDGRLYLDTAGAVDAVSGREFPDPPIWETGENTSHTVGDGVQPTQTKEELPVVADADNGTEGAVKPPHEVV